ncbi:unnamed protein product [Kluyveromyces dobzhanskii CBS 2104]|uniref:WGS project CCBQ000000000 data, contig 00099 n=1 Tax=Kluyveromyces dobzhanskii CBS 2104 TaxID=1427455 RepID=A0A0A8L4H5_9SACH|nr:unnamed protein product [Kluyveromyces dobzhanskii CBS 2104]
MAVAIASYFNIRIVQVVCAVIWCLLSAGIIFGFAALKPVLIDQHVYEDLCYIKVLEDSVVELPCTAQDLKLNKMFAIGAVVTNIIALPVGWVLDHYGPRVCGIIGSFFLFAGSFVYITAKQISLFDPYLIGYIFLAIGGPFVFISSFQLANTFPKYSGSILAVITGAFDSSSALFLFYRIYYQNVNSDLKLKRFFSIYLIVPAFIVLCQLFIMPSKSYKTLGAVHKLEVEGLDEDGNLPEGQDSCALIPDENECSSLLSGNAPQIQPVLSHSSRRKSTVLESYVEARLEKKTRGIFGVLHNESAANQIKSYWFILMQLFTIVTMLRINYFVATVRSQEEYLLGDPQLAAQMNSIFDVALPLGGVLSIPIIGIILDKMETYSVLLLISGLSVLIGILGLIPSFYPNLFSIMILVAFRPFYYTVVSDYCSKIFGFETFGTVYGLMICVSGCLNLFQTYLDKLTHTTFKMNPTPVNAILLATSTLISVALLGYIKTQSNRRAKLIDDALKSPSIYNST